MRIYLILITFISLIFVSENAKATESKHIQALINDAKDGFAIAQTHLGKRYLLGVGVPQDYKQALKWYTKAAEQGDVDAQMSLGLMYFNGNGVAKNYKQTFKWYIRAAEQGYADAQHNLGTLYDNGEGVLKDNKKALEWFTMAAEQGHAESQFNIGVMYYVGRKIPQDYNLAFKWFSKAAEKGYENARNNLDFMYKNGEGVSQDYGKVMPAINKPKSITLEPAELTKDTIVSLNACRMSLEFIIQNINPKYSNRLARGISGWIGLNYENGNELVTRIIPKWSPEGLAGCKKFGATKSKVFLLQAAMSNNLPEEPLNILSDCALGLFLNKSLMFRHRHGYDITENEAYEIGQKIGSIVLGGIVEGLPYLYKDLENRSYAELSNEIIIKFNANKKMPLNSDSNIVKALISKCIIFGIDANKL